jgi:hypothetical protein
MLSSRVKKLDPVDGSPNSAWVRSSRSAMAPALPALAVALRAALCRNLSLARTTLATSTPTPRPALISGCWLTSLRT